MLDLYAAMVERMGLLLIKKFSETVGMEEGK